MYDIIIIGAGPAGLTAGIYGGNANKKVLILEKNTYGGQIVNSNGIKNYPGLYGVDGFTYSTKLYEQAKELGCEIKIEEVTEVTNDKKVITNKGEYNAKTIIIATGVSPRKLNINNIDNLIGKGISFCATCDGMFFKGKDVAVIGGGNTAIDDAIYLSDIVNKVYLIYRKSDFRDNLINKDLLTKKDNIEIIFDSNVTEVIGENSLEEITISNDKTNKKRNIKISGMFIAIGQDPNSNIFNHLEQNGKYIISNEQCTTNIDGVFVAGDVRVKDIRQLTTACNDGTIAAINAIKWLNKK